MAIIKKDGNFMGLPMNIQRGNPIPLDDTAVWYSLDELNTYAASGATAYVGQIVTLIDETAHTASAYMISNTSGTLIKLASTTASGDLAGDVATLQGQVADIIEEIGDKTENTGLYAEIDAVKQIAEARLSALTAADASITVGGDGTAKTVKVAISTSEGNSLSVKTDGLFVTVPEVDHPEYTMTKLETATAGMSASYQLTKDGAGVGAVIDIPKDMVVQSGTVETYSAGSLPAGVTEAGTYIVLVLANANNDKLYIKVDELIEYVTSGSVAGDMVFINVDPQTHKVTASITDGTITETKLDSGIKGKLAKAESAVQTVAEGGTNGTIKVDDVDVAVHGLKSAAYTESSAYDAAGAAAGVKTELTGSTSDAKTAMTLYGVKAYADDVAATAKSEAVSAAEDKIANLNKTDSAVAKEFVTAVSESAGVITVSRRALTADDIPELGISKISGLQSAIDAKQDNLTFNTAYDSATNKAATMSDVNAAKSALVGEDTDTKDSNTVKGAKKYAEDRANTALSDAKAYADGLVTGDSGIAARVDALEEKVDVAKVSTAIATAKSEAIADAASKDAALKTAILGEANYAQTVKSAYEVATAAQGAADTAQSAAEAAQADADAAAAAAVTADGKAVAAQTDVDALETKVGDIPASATATTVVGYVDEKIAAIPAQTNYTVTMDTSTPAGVAKRYTLSQCGSAIGTIDIPKDMVVQSGAVETKTEAGVWGVAGTYLVLTLANATSDKIYINVGDLIEYVTSGSATGDMVVINIDAEHKVTATITDGTVTKAKLTAAVQTSLGKADTAVQPNDLSVYAKTADVAAGYVAKNGTDRLMQAVEGEKLAGIEEYAEVNVIEVVKVGGTALSVSASDRSVDITEISTDLLKQGTDTLVLKGGNAATLAQA